ncbi:MAG: hypothetical protein J0H98_08190 [Solirubrobacterales bacterium]|nr:hypothetical protein [Solirubrobacterales bacterium]
MIPIGPAEPADSVGMDASLQGTMPGGQTTATLTVARDPRLRDIDPFDELVIRDVGGTEVWSGYGVEYPARDGEGPSVEISATGWSGYLKDNPPPPLIAVDRKFDSWQPPPLVRKAAAGTSVTWDKAYTASAEGGLEWTGASGAQIAGFSIAELYYAASAGAKISRVDYRGTAANTANTVAPGVYYSNAEDMAGATSVAQTLDNTIRTASIPTASRYLAMQVLASSTHTPAAGSAFNRRIDMIAVYGDHGIPLYPIGDGTQGVLASDVVNWGLTQACPLLTPEISSTSFVIPHLVETDLEDMEALVMVANATELYDWGCFGKRFVFRPAGTGRTWVVRSSDPGVSLTDAGEQGDDTYTRCIVSFGDPGGKSVKVGYPGSGADVETAALVDTSSNVLTQRGRPRTLKLSLTATSTVARAIQAGQVALREKARVNQRGDAVLTGEAQDTAGVWRNVCQVQSGDQIIFADRGWIPRRIVDNTYAENTDSQAVSLDSTPAKLDAILERMGVINEGNNL